MHNKLCSRIERVYTQYIANDLPFSITYATQSIVILISVTVRPSLSTSQGHLPSTFEREIYRDLFCLQCSFITMNSKDWHGVPGGIIVTYFSRNLFNQEYLVIPCQDLQRPLQIWKEKMIRRTSKTIISNLQRQPLFATFSIQKQETFLFNLSNHAEVLKFFWLIVCAYPHILAKIRKLQGPGKFIMESDSY